jgi:hypothetical protein
MTVIGAFESKTLDLRDFYFTGDDYRYRFDVGAKQRFINLLRERFNAGVAYKGRVLKWDTVIEQKATELGRFLTGKSPTLDFVEPAPSSEQSLYGYDFVGNLSTKIRFSFIVQHLPELKAYNELAKKLNELRDKTEHSDTYVPAKSMLDALLPEAESLFKQLDSLIKKIESHEAFVDLRAQRKLLTLFLDWLQEDFDGYV